MTSQDKLTSISKFLSLVLRHQPQAIGLHLDGAGWASIEELLAKAAAANRPLSRPLLDEVVQTSDKQRFAVSEDGLKIRANRGGCCRAALRNSGDAGDRRNAQGGRRHSVLQVRQQRLACGCRASAVPDDQQAEDAS